jgi:hypothetical protein
VIRRELSHKINKLKGKRAAMNQLVKYNVAPVAGISHTESLSTVPVLTGAAILRGDGPTLRRRVHRG